jgi:hypothetical protein
MSADPLHFQYESAIVTNEDVHGHAIAHHVGQQSRRAHYGDHFRLLTKLASQLASRLARLALAKPTLSSRFNICSAADQSLDLKSTTGISMHTQYVTRHFTEANCTIHTISCGASPDALKVCQPAIAGEW